MDSADCDQRLDVYSFGKMMIKIWNKFVNKQKSKDLTELLEKMIYYDDVNCSFEKRIFIKDVIEHPYLN